jgi:S-formylglutathione hydrolase FrmB
VPAGGGKRPLLVFLHGRGLRPGSLLSDEFFAGLQRLGERAPIVVARELGADPSRVAIGGISMGGYGAFDLAHRARAGRFCAVGGHSPAFWLSADPFRPYDAEIVRALKARGARLTSRIWPGDHSGEYWRAHIGRYLRFYADALARC